VRHFTKISVLVPTRQRLESLSSLLTTFELSVGNSDQAELIFRCDNDDADTIARLRCTPYTFIVGPRRDGYRSLPSFFNEMAAIASGDILMCCNDDVEFRTPGWPALLLEEANRYPDGVFNIGVNVGLNDDKFPFSVVSRALVQAIGCLNDPRLLFSDVFLLDVAKSFNRAVRLETVTIFHDWAGHRADETRRDANQHEFDVVFKDAQGNWSDAYQERHEAVVAEAADRIRRSAIVMPDVAVEQLERYQPPDARSPSEHWPPGVSCQGWNSEPSGHSIHYSKSEVTEVIRVMYRYGITGGDVLLSSYGNGLSSVLWSQLFDRVVAVAQSAPSDKKPFSSGKHTILFGSTGDTRFLCAVVTEIQSLRAIVFDESYYASIISPYFFMRRLLRRPAIVVFTNTGPGQKRDVGARRFVGELRTGFLDNTCHEVVDVPPDPRGPGMSYELVL
jgi:hypothetical protein